MTARGISALALCLTLLGAGVALAQNVAPQNTAPQSTAPQSGIPRTEALRLEGTYAPGSSNNRLSINLSNDTAYATPEFSPKPTFPLQWLRDVRVTPNRTSIPAGGSQNFVITFDVSADAPADLGETLSVFFAMGEHLSLHRLDLVAHFGGAAPPLPEQITTEFDPLEFHESFVAGSTGNGVVFRIENTSAYPVAGLNLRPHLPSQYMLLEGIAPQDVDLEPGEVVEIIASFAVRKDAKDGVEDRVEFHFDSDSAIDLPLPAYRMIALITADEEDDDATLAQCNSAVDAGGNEGGGVTVDLAGFVGKAGFTWEMYGVKDRMDVTVGGVTRTTGCVSNSGTFELLIPPGARTAEVKVIPNCEGTSSTQWNFTFECPLASDVTADGSGNSTDPDSTAQGTAQGTVQGGQGAGVTTTTSLGQPVQPAPRPPTPILPSGTVTGEGENNDTVATATPLRPGDGVQGTIAQNGDADFYAVTVAHQGELTIRFPQVPAGIDIAVLLRDSAGNALINWRGSSVAGQAYDTRVDLRVPGRYLIEVRDAYNNASSTAPYHMLTSFVPTADPAELNDDLATATFVGWNTAVLANILPIRDADFYRIEAPRQGRMTVTIDQSGPETDMTFKVWDGAGQTLSNWQSATPAGASLSAWVDLPEPGTYYVEMRDAYNNARSATPYRMVLSLDQTPDMGEPNDSGAQATLIQLDQLVMASILPIGDGDIYALDLPHQGELTVEISQSAPNTDMTFRVLDSDAEVVRNWQTAAPAGSPLTAWADIKRPGRYLIEMRDAYNNAAAPVPYVFTARLRPTQDWAEPNDQMSQATPIALGQRFRANILPINDGDIYRVDVPAHGRLNLSVLGSGDATDITIRTLAADGTVVRNWQSAPGAGAAFEAHSDIAQPGTYFLEVRDAYNNARAPDPYEMQVTLTPAMDRHEPNNTVGDAQPIGLGDTVTGAIFPLSDHDVYRLSIPRAGTLRLVLLDSPAGVDMTFQVENAGGGVVHGWRGSGQAGKGFDKTVEIAAPGVYYLRFADSYSNARAPEAYRFRATLE